MRRSIVFFVLLSAVELCLPTSVFSQTANGQAPSRNTDNRQKQGGAVSLDCKSKRMVQSFYVDATGNVSDKGKSFEGPVCIEVHFNPLTQRVSFATTETRAAGPDLTTVFPGASTKPGGPGPTPDEQRQEEERKKSEENQLSVAFKNLASDPRHGFYTAAQLHLRQTQKQ